MAEDAEDTLRDLEPPEFQKHPEEHDPGKRKFLSLIPTTLVAAAVGGLVRKAVEKPEAAQPPSTDIPTAKLPESKVRPESMPSAEGFADGELTANWVNSFKRGFSRLDRKHVYFVDQNGNVVGDEYIEVPEDILRQEDDPDFEDKIFQPWLDRTREAIKEKYPTVYVDLGKRDQPQLISIRTSVGEGKGDISLINRVRRNMERPVSGKDPKTRYELAKEKLEKSKLPPALARLLLGSCGVESAFEDLPPNKANGHPAGAWQINEEEGKRYGLITKKEVVTGYSTKRTGKGKRRKIERTPIKENITIDDRRNFEKATRAAISLYEEALKKIRKEPIIKKFQETYELSDEDFLYPAVMNYYHSGPARTRGMCEWFMKRYPPPEIEKILGKGEHKKDIYTLALRVYLNAHHDSGFGIASASYVNKARAMADLYDSKEPSMMLAYEPPEPPKTEVEAEELLNANTAKKTLENGNNDFRNLALAALAGTGIGVMDSIGKGLEGSESRRKFIGRVVTATLAGAAGGEATKALAAEKKPKPAPKPKGPFEGPIPLDMAGVRAVLLEDVRLTYFAMKYLTLIPSHKDNIKLDSEMRDLLQVGLTVAERYSLSPFQTKEDIRAASGIAQIPAEASSHYRLRGVGQTDSRIIKNNMDYAYCYQHTEELIRTITDKFNEALHQEGFSERYRMRLIVTSMARDEIFQKELRKTNLNAAARISPHQYGFTFDISRLRYDVIDQDTGRFCMVSNAANDPVNEKFHLQKIFDLTLREVLKDLKTIGDISVIPEVVEPVYHISDLKPL